MLKKPTMRQKIGYDLDGVLAEKPPQAEKKWGRMNGAERRARKESLISFYRYAKPLIPWDKKSMIISARKQEAEVQNATMEWFLEHYGKVPQIYFLDKSRNVENVVKFKARVLRSNRIKEFYEDNKKVLRGVKRLYPNCKYFFIGNESNIIPF